MPAPLPIPTIDAAIREAQRNRDAAEWSEDLRHADFWQAEVDHLMAERASGEMFAVPF